MSKHTEGPWELNVGKQRITVCGKLAEENNGIRLKYPRHRLIGELFGSDEEGLANARLIAAAPELLEACKRGLDWMRNEGVGLDDQIFIKQAIAKAEGKLSPCPDHLEGHIFIPCDEHSATCTCGKVEGE